MNRRSLPSDERKCGASRRHLVVQSLSLATRSKTVGRSLLTAGRITSPRLSPVITELVPIRRPGAGPNRCSKKFVAGKIADLLIPGIMNCRLVVLLVLQSGGDGFIKEI